MDTLNTRTVTEAETRLIQDPRNLRESIGQSHQFSLLCRLKGISPFAGEHIPSMNGVYAPLWLRTA